MNPRSYLFVPGNRPELIAKALASQAEAVVIDLEDAVPQDHKDDARSLTTQALAKMQPADQARVWVRINAVRTHTAERDLAAVAGSTIGIRVPKVDFPDDLDWVAARSANAPLLATIETARGLNEAAAIAACPRVARLALGGLDLIRDLGCTDDPLALLYARSALVVASRTAGLPGPINSVYTKLNDEPGLIRHARHAASLGFGAQSLLSPRQIEAVHSAFGPDAAETTWATNVLAAFEAAGGQATASSSGEFIDLPVARRATAIVNHSGRGDTFTR